jgi:hypothetical protein
MPHVFDDSSDDGMFDPSLFQHTVVELSTATPLDLKQNIEWDWTAQTRILNQIVIMNLTLSLSISITLKITCPKPKFMQTTQNPFNTPQHHIYANFAKLIEIMALLAISALQLVHQLLYFITISTSHSLPGGLGVACLTQS